MFKLLQWCNNIVETTQLTNNQISKFRCQCECSKCPPPAPSSNTSLQSLTLISLSQPCWSVLVAAVAPDNLTRFLDFGDCFWLCSKLGVSLQHCIPHVIVHWIYIRHIWRPLDLCDEVWTAGSQPVPCAARSRCVCWHAVQLESEPGGQPAIALKEP